METTLLYRWFWVKAPQPTTVGFRSVTSCLRTHHLTRPDNRTLHAIKLKEGEQRVPFYLEIMKRIFILQVVEISPAELYWYHNELH